MSSMYGEAAGEERPLPKFDSLAAPFWTAAHAGRLEFQHCADCGYVLWPAASRCPECLSAHLDWRSVSGNGCVWSWAVYETALHPAFVDEIPYIVAGVQLDEGPYLTSNVVDARATELYLGMRLEVVFEQIDENISLPRFRPATDRSVAHPPETGRPSAI
ncbi:Zn-ribbon domain-containing OB-fold protein [Gordonia sesuvii]|uniref:Zn-ribbon domain-containing OB-fold protein n=1 Tax=Gordonia sesuvii TaxID=3116777 RepID=UPI003D66F1CA